MTESTTKRIPLISKTGLVAFSVFAAVNFVMVSEPAHQQASKAPSAFKIPDCPILSELNQVENQRYEANLATEIDSLETWHNLVGIGEEMGIVSADAELNDAVEQAFLLSLENTGNDPWNS